MDSIESTILSVSMNPDSPGEQLQAATSPQPLVPQLLEPPPQVYQQAPSLTPPANVLSSEILDEISVPPSEEVLLPQSVPIAVEPIAVDEPLMAIPVVEEQQLQQQQQQPSIPTVTTPLPPPVASSSDEVPPESMETEALEMTPVVNNETAQVEAVQGEVEASIEATPTGKRPRTKKPKSTSKASKSKTKKEADSWMDGEALSSAGADTNDEVFSGLPMTFNVLCRIIILFILFIFFLSGETSQTQAHTYFQKESQEGRGWY